MNDLLAVTAKLSNHDIDMVLVKAIWDNDVKRVKHIIDVGHPASSFVMSAACRMGLQSTLK